jgi:hypothetical protein
MRFLLGFYSEGGVEVVEMPRLLLVRGSMTDVNDCAVNRDYSLVESKLMDLSRDSSIA